jgi:hypothetical protein
MIDMAIIEKYVKEYEEKSSKTVLSNGCVVRVSINTYEQAMEDGFAVRFTVRMDTKGIDGDVVQMLCSYINTTFRSKYGSLASAMQGDVYPHCIVFDFVNKYRVESGVEYAQKVSVFFATCVEILCFFDSIVFLDEPMFYIGRGGGALFKSHVKADGMYVCQMAGSSEVKKIKGSMKKWHSRLEYIYTLEDTALRKSMLSLYVKEYGV